MNKLIGSVVLISVFLSGVLTAQKVAPSIGIDHLMRVEMVRKLGQTAQETCAALPVVKNYNAARKETNDAIETAYQGWTLDWASMKLVEKAPEKVQ